MATISEIDAQIGVLERQLAQLKHRRNSLVPFFRLPTEMVVRIFKLLQEDYSTPFANSTLTTKSMGTTCRRLREIALQTPDLWTVIDCRRERWAELCAQRAGLLSLDLIISRLKHVKNHNADEDKVQEVDDEDEEDDEDKEDEEADEDDEDERASEGSKVTPHILLIASKYLKQARSADLRLPSHDEENASSMLKLCSSLSQTSHLLRSLKLRISDHREIPTPLLGGSSSLLQTLHLEGCTIFKLPHLPSLSRLKCRDCQLVQGVATIQPALCHMPNLEFLTLQISTITTTEIMHMPGDLVPPRLPYLRQLEVCESSQVIDSWLSILPTPRQLLVIRTLQPFIHINDGSHIHIIRFIRQLWDLYACEHQFPSATLRSLKFHGEWQWVLTFDCSEPLEQPRGGERKCEIKTTTSILRFAQPIHSHIKKGSLHWFHLDLWKSVDYPSYNNPPRLTGLKELEFRSALHDFSLDDLGKWLQARRDSGYPIERLVFMDAHESLQHTSQAGAIDKIVDEVTWVRSE